MLSGFGLEKVLPQLLVMRHGQAMFGNDNYDELSVLGLQQAEQTGAFFKSRAWQFDKIYLGPRHRHAQTLQGVLAGMYGSYNSQDTMWKEIAHIDTALDEFADGSKVLQSAKKRILAAKEIWPASRREQLVLYVQELHGWANGEFVIDDCVSADDFKQGAAAWLAGLMQHHKQRGEHILAVTSAGTIAAMLCSVLQLPASQLAEFTIAMYNASLTHLLFRDDSITVRMFNSAHHLPVVLVTQI